MASFAASRASAFLPIGGGAIAIAGTLLSLVRNPHWAFRMWDFPRNVLAAIGAASTVAYPLLRPSRSAGDGIFLTAVAASTIFQSWRMRSWTRLKRPTVRRTAARVPERSLRLLVSNVQRENRKHDRWLAEVRACDPDLVLALEIDAEWMSALGPLDDAYPFSVKHPQDNCFGMGLWSRLPLVDPQLDFLVQEDVPSIHTGVLLRDGTEVRLYCIHPRPPEPLRDQDSEPRDVELLLVGKEIGSGADPRPTIVAGDLNDVAWSRTTVRFLEMSGLADPRVGRGMFNSYNAKNPLFRWPLDHVFHSTDFTLTKLQRRRYVGSDHFPMLVELCHDPAAAKENRPALGSAE